MRTLAPKLVSAPDWTAHEDCNESLRELVWVREEPVRAKGGVSVAALHKGLWG